MGAFSFKKKKVTKLFTPLHFTDKRSKTQIVIESGLEFMSFPYHVTNRACNVIVMIRTHDFRLSVS